MDTPARRPLARTLASLALPGLGQLLQARWLDGLLLAWVELWLRFSAAGLAKALDPAADVLAGAVIGGGALFSGVFTAHAVFVLAASAGLRVLAARSVWRGALTDDRVRGLRPPQSARDQEPKP